MAPSDAIQRHPRVWQHMRLGSDPVPTAQTLAQTLRSRGLAHRLVNGHGIIPICTLLAPHRVQARQHSLTQALALHCAPTIMFMLTIFSRLIRSRDPQLIAPSNSMQPLIKDLAPDHAQI